MEQILLTPEENPYSAVSYHLPNKEAKEMAFEAGAKAQRKKVLGMGLQFHVVEKEMLGEVGEWAECQDIGVFIYLTREQWQALCKEVE